MIDQDFLADTCTGDSEERNNGVACVEAITMEMDDSSTLRWVPILLLIEPGDTLNEALVLVPICNVLLITKLCHGKQVNVRILNVKRKNS